MKTLLAAALVLLTSAPALTAQAQSGFTGKWEGTYKIQKGDGTEADPRQIVFNLTQKAKELSGTAGPPEEQLKIEKGTVDAGKAVFQVPLPNGSMFKFVLTIVKGRLQGDMNGERDGKPTGHAKVDAERSKAK